MEEKLYELPSDGITYLLASDSPRLYKEPIYKTIGFRLGQQEQVYVLKPEIKEYQGKPTEYAAEFIKRHLMAERERQLSEWASNTPDILPSIGADNPWRLVSLLTSAGRERPSDLNPTVYWNRLDQGLAVVSLTPKSNICFDFRSQRFMMEDGGPLSRPLFEFMHPRHFQLDIAEAQYKLGVRNPGYTELARINQFLANQNSVCVLLRNGMQHRLKSQFDLTASAILRLGAAGTKLELNDHDGFQPHVGPGVPAEEIEALLHGDERLDVNTAAICVLFGVLPSQEQAQNSFDMSL